MHAMDSALKSRQKRT